MYTNKQLLRLLLPLLVEQTLSIFVGMADTIMVSSLGDAAISGVSLVDMICNVLITLFAALATGGAVVASQLLGANRRNDACRVANQLVMVVLMVSVAIMLPMIFLREQVFGLLFGGVEQDVWNNAMTYMWITALSYPFIAVYNGGAALYRSMSKSGMTMLVSVLVNIINVGGNALCIFGLKMGVTGVAIPTLLSRMAGAVCMMLLLSNTHLQVHLLHGAWKPDLRMMKEILHIGVPSGVENSLFQLGRVLVVQVIALFGTVQTAANAVANTLDTVGCLPGTAVNLAIISVVGHCVGAGDYRQARHYTKKLILWAYIATAAVNVPLLLMLKKILPVFSASPEALELAYILVMIHDGMAILMWPAAFTLPNALRAASDVRYTMIVSLASMALFRIVFSYILGVGFGWGAVGVWVAMVLDWVCRIICYVIRYRSGKWETQAKLAV
ncbi:MAG: MATE family efflux transporter [Clostridia bacterium]|nr:MATE family efflux transporter [Clostridia bacterium]